jgi:hypothetical protein
MLVHSYLQFPLWQKVVAAILTVAGQVYLIPSPFPPFAAVWQLHISESINEFHQVKPPLA